MTQANENRENREQKPSFLTVEEWAERMRISRSSAYSHVNSGKMDDVVVRVGKLIRIRAEAV